MPLNIDIVATKKIQPINLRNSLLPFIPYFIIAAIHLLAILLGTGFETLVMTTKPLLLLSLLIIYAFLSRKNHSYQRVYMLLALLFSWLGDILLMFQGLDSVFFLLGLICFLLAHVGYIIAFNQTVSTGNPRVLRNNPWTILIFIAYGTGIFMLIKNGLGNMLIPVIIYMCIILLMGISALNRYGQTSLKSFVEVFAGAIFFMISDSILAINKFSQPVMSATPIIMSTYIIAQLLIVKGMVDELNQQNESPIKSYNRNKN